MGECIDYNLSFNEEINSWDDALPLGNGLIGCLVWGSGETLKFSLDRGDLWDTRVSDKTLREDFNFNELKRLVSDRNEQKIVEVFDNIYNEATPTKIPAGRLELNYGCIPTKVKNFLDISSGIATVRLSFNEDESTINTFLHASERYGYIKVNGSIHPQLIEKTHDFTNDGKGKVGSTSLDTSDVSALDYPPKEIKQIDGINVIIQNTREELGFALIVGEKENRNKKDIVYFIASTNDGESWLDDGINKVRTALENGYDSCIKDHKDWWSNYWKKSSISVPNEKIEKLWYLNLYLFGATSREGCPPMPLQGVWTADNGKLPPWKGDYHNDLNTQFSYLHYLKDNRIEEGKSFIDFLWSLVPRARQYAKEFFGVEGLALPGVMDIKGNPLGGWAQYSFAITNNAWLCQMFHEYWLYTGDDEFLKNKGYVFLKESAQVLVSLFKYDDKGYYTLPLTSSPEIHDNTLEAWLRTLSNYDLSIIMYLFEALKRESEHLGYLEDLDLWNNTLSKLRPLCIKNDVLMIDEIETLEESHRHHAHCMSIYPLDLLTYENGNKTIIDSTINDLERLGTEWWVGYSFSWMASLYSRAKNGDKAEKQLEIFNDCFSSVNGFHVNGDYKNNGACNFTYKIFTLEGNMAAIDAIQEMLLQTYDNTVRVFEAIPDAWREKGTSFENFRGEGGILISSEIKNNSVIKLEITPTRNWNFKVKNPFGHNDVIVQCGNERFTLNGEILDIKGEKDKIYKFYKIS